MNLVVSTRTIFTALLVLLSFWLLVQIKTVVIALFVALILALGLASLVDSLCRKGFSRSLAVLVVFLVAVASLVVVGVVSLPPMVEQTQRFWKKLPQLAEAFFGQTYGEKLNAAFFGQLTTTSGSVVKVTLDVFANALMILTVLVFTFYFLLDLENMKMRLITLFPKEYQAKLKETVLEVEVKLGRWLRGQVALMLIVGLMTFVGLNLLRLDYALPLALIAGLLEIVPMLGPVLGAVPALLVGFTTSFVSGLGVLALYILVQQLENNVIVPRVMHSAIGFNPVVTMIVLLIGGKLLGIVGALLAVPATLFGYIIIKNWLLDYKDHLP